MRCLSAIPRLSPSQKPEAASIGVFRFLEPQWRQAACRTNRLKVDVLDNTDGLNIKRVRALMLILSPSG
jgi:hypothetical protein